MTDYVGNTTVTTENTVAVVMAELETALELQDSTNNPIKSITINPLPNGKFQGVLVTTGTIA